MFDFQSGSRAPVREPDESAAPAPHKEDEAEPQRQPVPRLEPGNEEKVGGLGNSLADLPAAGAAPEWMSEKAITIGQYFVASGIYTIFGVTFPIVENTKFHELLFNGLEKEGMGKWGFTPDPYEMARLMIEHIDAKRKALGIDKSRERLLVDMSDRRSLDAA